jgi:hypothetical protein
VAAAKKAAVPIDLSAGEEEVMSDALYDDRTERRTAKETRLSARLQAEQIRDYWAAQGYAVRTWVEKVVVRERRPHHGSCSMYVVRSDMLDGMPLELALQKMGAIRC